MCVCVCITCICFLGLFGTTHHILFSEPIQEEKTLFLQFDLTGSHADCEPHVTVARVSGGAKVWSALSGLLDSLTGFCQLMRSTVELLSLLKVKGRDD